MFFKGVSVGFVCSLGLMASFGCTVKEQLDDMHDKTVQMAKTTEDMAKTTKEMSETTKDMSKTTKDMSGTTNRMSTTTNQLLGSSQEIKSIANDTYKDMRGGATKDIRIKALEEMIKNAEMPVKLESASSYFYSFEFQTWKDQGTDDTAKLNDLKQLAVLEFLEDVQKFTTYSYAGLVKPMADQLLDFYALAATCHRTYPSQERLAKERGFPLVSIYTIMEEGLRAELENPTWDPDQMPLHIYYVQHFKPIVLEVLKARVTYLPFHAYAEIRGLNERSTIGALFRSMKDRLGWDLNLYQMNPVQIARYAEYLRYSLLTRRLLADVGVDSQPDNAMLTSLKIMDVWGSVHLTGSLSPNDPAPSLKEAEVARFRKLLGYILMSPKDFQQVSADSLK